MVHIFRGWVCHLHASQASFNLYHFIATHSLPPNNCPPKSRKNPYPILAAIHNTGLIFPKPGGEEAAMADALFPSLQAYRLTIAAANTANSKQF